MNMSNQSIESLNALVDAKASAAYGASTPITGLKAINEFLEASYIPADMLTIDTGQATSPLDGHVLLGGSHILQVHLDSLWLSLHGGGTKSIRTFGDLENDQAFLRCVGAFKDAKLVRTMRTTDIEPGDLAERILLCIRLLSASSTASTMPLPFASVQRHLSEILLTYPALMHPRVLIPVSRGKSTEYMSILHAVAAAGAGLPRRSHFLAGTGGLRVPLPGTPSDIEKLDDRLHAFARHPCVRFALKRQSCIHVQASAIKNGTSNRNIVAKSLRLAEFAFGTPGPKVQFMASVMELEDLVVKRSTDPLSTGQLPLPMQLMAPALVSVPRAAMPWAVSSSGAYSDSVAAAGKPAPGSAASFDVTTPEFDAATARELETTLILKTLAASVYAASGLIHTPTSVSTSVTTTVALPGIGDATIFEPLVPNEVDSNESGPWRHSPNDPAFLDCIAKRAGLLATHVEFGKQVEQIMARRVFLGRFDDLCVADIRTNAEGAVAGMLRSGLASSRADAGKFIVESVLGRNRNAGNTDTLPKVELASAAEFLAVVEETGGFDLAPAESTMYSYNDVLEATMAAVVGFPNHATPFRDTWSRAIQVFANSRMMSAVIAQRMSGAGGAVASNASDVGEASVSASALSVEPVVESRRRRASI